jgi:predicted PurR-regulated permease PerM
LAWGALIPFILGLIVAYIIMPVVNLADRHAPPFLRRRGRSRSLAILLVYIVGAGVVAGMLAYFIPALTEQARQLVVALPRYLSRVTKLVESVQSYLLYDLSEVWDSIAPDIRAGLGASIQRAAQTVAEGVQRGLGYTVQAVFQTVSFILGMLIVPFWLFYVLRDESRAIRSFYSLLPEGVREDAHCIVRIVDDLLSAYIRGQLLLCVIVGALATIACLVLGVDLALLLGTIAGILEIVPILGPWLGAIPAILVALAGEPITALWVALAFAGIQQVENLFLVPRISGKAVRFHPAVVMVLVVIGSDLAGLWGVLMVVPLAAVLRDIYQYLYLRTTERGATPQMALDALHARTL